MNTNVEIGIVDTRNIVKAINDVYGFDLTNYALTSLKRRLEKILILHNIKNADNLILKINSSPDYFERFLKDFLVESTEMFRDPSLWRWIRDNYFAELIHIDPGHSIWLPECVGGDELFSLCVLLKESNLLDKVRVIASSLSQLNIDQIKKGICNIKKLETSAENYKRFNGSGDFSTYYRNDEIQIIRDTRLIENVDFRIFGIKKEDYPRQIDMILYRNHFIYFNQTLQDEVTEKMMGSLRSGGLLVIGNKETLGRQFLNDFVLINHSESVYKKR